MKAKSYLAVVLWSVFIGTLVADATGIDLKMSPLTGSSLTLAPGPLAVGKEGISTDAGIISTYTGDKGSYALGASFYAKNNVNISTIQLESGAGINWSTVDGSSYIYRSGTNTISCGASSGGCHFGALDFAAHAATGVVAIQTETGAKTCLGSTVTGCLTYDGTSVASSVGLTSAVTTGTPASGTGITAVATSQIRNYVHKVTVINTALAAAGTSDVTLHVTPVNTRIARVVADVTQVFTGGTLSAMTVQCGNAAGGTQYLLANSVFTAQNTWGDVVAEMGAGLVSATLADFGTVAAGVPGAITVQCRFTCTGANCNAATQGSVTFYVEGVTYP